MRSFGSKCRAERADPPAVVRETESEKLSSVPDFALAQSGLPFRRAARTGRDNDRYDNDRYDK
jgi:hypothetical protein